MELKVEQSGSFYETYDAFSTSPEPYAPYPRNVIFPIYFSNIFNKLMESFDGVYAEDWTSHIKTDYIYGVSFDLLSLSAFYELPSKLLAGFVDIEDDDSDGIKTQKLLNNYSRFQKVGLKCWVRATPLWRYNINYGSNSTWFPVGETILQNKGIQMKINLLPYFGATKFDALNGAIGISFIDKGDGRLSGNDYITLVGEWKYTLTAFPKVIGRVSVVPSIQGGTDGN